MAQIKFFSPTDVFGLNSESWHITSGGNPNKTTSYTQILGSEGDQIASAPYDHKETVTATYTNDSADGFLVIPKVGAMLNGYHVDTITVKYGQTEPVTMEVAGHKHLEGKPDKDCRTYSSTVKLPAMLKCVPSSLAKAGEGASGDAFKLGVDADAGMRSLSYTLQCNHVDEAGGCGEHLAGNNHDGSETIDIELTGEVELVDLGIDAEWDVDSHSLNQSNTSATTTSVSMNKHIPHDVIA